MAFNKLAVSEANTAIIDGLDAGGISAIWRRVRAHLREECGPALYSQEIARLRVRLSETGALVIIAPSNFNRDWVEDHWGARIRALWAELDPSHRDVHLLAEGQDAPQPVMAARLPAAASRSPAPTGLTADTAPTPADGTSPGDARFSFDSFRVGPANEVAAAAARTMVGASTPPFNPVFFYGDYGVGKTHLLHAVASAARNGSRPRKALYLTAEEFLSGFVTAMKACDTISFKETVRGVDVLLIDDVHFIAGKPKTEDEFLHTIAALVAENKQVVLASHKPPAELQMQDERLRSLLTGGLSCPLGKPDLDLRRQILDCKIAQATCHYPTFDVSEAVRDFLAARITSSPREMEGVLNNVICRTALIGQPVTMEVVSTALRELSLSSERRLTVDEIQKVVATHFGISTADICSKRRTQAVVRPRHIAMYLAKTLTTRSLPDIGRRFGGRDHSTVIHAVSKVTGMIDAGDSVADEIDALTRELQG
ncbi:chromosomal replication initiator protein DnaA [Maricaulis sp.]|uniref:chromosomal replication initiator protein DnaA n=1 Tax=Maricaulis sp. TaxID=1486257 RepID=UPI000C374337|nr:chromosomal replication initiator protein DnaA [Maricaulis sp.]MAC87953.1 chromosomal replication initiator protein DnaA [Maricaulis sp.]